MSEYTFEENGLKILNQWGYRSFVYNWNQGKFLRTPKEFLLGSAVEVEYTALPGPSCIRLLRIEAGRPADVLRCSLHIVDLDTQPNYAALSYTWKQDPSLRRIANNMVKDSIKNYMRGDKIRLEIPNDAGDADRLKTIVCNGKATKVFPNLHNALIQLRRRQPGDYWIDAICINQTDLVERASQVHLMGRIYGSASLVIVWLGFTTWCEANGIATLERLARDKAVIPDYNFWIDFPEIRSPPGVNAVGKDMFDAMTAAWTIGVCQWFRRVWVLQELCLAKKVVYALNDWEISDEAILMAFQIINRTIPGIGISALEEGQPQSGASFAPVWVPQVQFIPTALNARETFRYGGKWTLGQWLMLCKGRMATDRRDLVFGGLAVIRPESLHADPSILVAPRTTTPKKPRNALMKHYPQTIPAFGTKNAPRIGWDEKKMPLPSLHVQSLLPRGIWKVLKADYAAGEAEVLLNAACCLLSESGTSQLLSIAARIRNPEVHENEWLLVPPDKSPSDDLPSWVPSPGSWTSRIIEDLVSRTASKFAAGDELRNPPRVSQDGTSLLIDASKLDQVDKIILNADFLNELAPTQLRDLLQGINTLDTRCYGTQSSTFDALSRVLISSQIGELGHLSADDASRWLCYTLSEAVARQVYGTRPAKVGSWLSGWIYRDTDRTRDDIAVGTKNTFIATWSESSRRDPDRTLDDIAVGIKNIYTYDFGELEAITKAYREVKAKFPEQPWPANFDPIQIDKDIHAFYIAFEKRREDADLGREGKEGEKLVADKTESSSQRDLRAWRARRGAAALYAHLGRKREDLPEVVEFEPDDPELDSRYNNAALLTLAWRKVFVTKEGYLGIGPRWLAEGDTVMLVHGAPVPYIFRKVDDDLKQQEKIVAKFLDENDEEYHKIVQMKQNDTRSQYHPIRIMKNKRWDGMLKALDEQRVMWQKKLGNIEREIGRRDGWVLLGEAYVEGVMYGNVKGNKPTERVTVV